MVDDESYVCTYIHFGYDFLSSSPVSCSCTSNNDKSFSRFVEIIMV